MLIVIGHSQDFVHAIFPDTLIGVIGYGGIGVTMFAFLSGIGLWQSINRDNNVANFYKKRIHRVLIPYFVISVLFNVYLDLYMQRSPTLFVEEIFFVSYWTKGRGAWFVAWLLPIYSKVSQKQNYISAILAAIGIGAIAIHGIPVRFESVAAATFAFLIGDFMGGYVKRNSLWCMRLIPYLIVVAPVYFLGILRNQAAYVVSFAVVGISLCGILALFLELLPNKARGRLAKIGAVSLESYLFNVYLISVTRPFLEDKIATFIGVVVYALWTFKGWENE